MQRDELPSGLARLPTGLEVLPHYGFADYERIVGRAPDLIVIPNLTAFAPGVVPGSERPVLQWIRAHAGPQTTTLAAEYQPPVPSITLVRSRSIPLKFGR